MSRDTLAKEFQLEILGSVSEGAETILLIGPHEPGFWRVFSTSPEYLDGLTDPLDRWSKRVVGALANELGGQAVFPSDGPPYPPFLSWAENSGTCWVSPVGLRIHPVTGLWLSFRGAIQIAGQASKVAPDNPCLTCSDKPCLTACPVDALKLEAYDVARCHAWFDQLEGRDCLQRGCAVRRACPVSQKYGRVDAQSAFHMKAFHHT